MFKPKEVDIFSNYRYYLDTQINDILLIKELKEAGFLLEEIKKYWNNWNDFILLQQKEKIYLEKQELDIKIKKIDNLRTRIKDGIIYKKEIEVVRKRERK